jgi:hypothetical protein
MGSAARLTYLRKIGLIPWRDHFLRDLRKVAKPDDNY